MRADETDAGAQFDALWRDHAARVQAYAARHVGVLDAQDVVAETFIVAWRRRRDVPPDALPWLLVVARNTVANRRRAAARRPALTDLMRTDARAFDEPDHEVAERAAYLGALAQLSLDDQETLLLTAWDGLAPAAAAQVAGCSTSAFKVRLHRARRRLTALLDATEPLARPRPTLAPEGGRTS